MSKQVSRQRLWQRRKAALGRCTNCGQPSNLSKCLACRIKAAMRWSPDKPFDILSWKGRHYTK